MTVHEAKRYIEFAVTYSGPLCLLWPYAHDRYGYPDLRLKGGHTSVSRLICERIHGPPPTSLHCALHSCDRGHIGCVTPGHLRWGTKKENTADMHARGRSNAKLTKEEAQEIRSICGWTHQSVADLYGVTQGHVTRIINRNLWKFEP